MSQDGGVEGRVLMRFWLLITKFPKWAVHATGVREALWTVTVGDRCHCAALKTCGLDVLSSCAILE